MITRLRLKNFKSFADETLHMGPFSVVVGANSAGKSNIRDALRFLHGVGRGYTLAEIIGGKWGAGGQSEWAAIRGSGAELIRFGQSSFSLEVDLKTDFFGPSTYRLDIQIDPSSRTGFRVIRESLGGGYWMTFTSHPGSHDKVHAQLDENHLQLRMEKTGNQRKWGQKIEVRNDQPALVQLLDQKRVVRPHKLQIEEVVEALSAIRFLDLVPDAMRKPAFPGQSVLGDSGENLSTVLQGVCEDPKRAETLYEWIRELTPLDVAKLDFPRDSVTGLVQLQLVEHSGARVSAYSASDGTLRFLAMLAALLGDDPAAFYFFEEVDNGIHPARLKLLVDLIENVTGTGATQVLTTTHSPELVSMLSEDSFANLAVVARVPGESHSHIARVGDLANISAIKGSQRIERLMASGWFEDVLAFRSSEDPAIAA